MCTLRCLTPADGHPRVALVTGAASGIGRAVALFLAAGGTTVIAADIDDGGLAETSGASGGAIVPVIADLTDAEACRQAVAVAAGAGPLQALVNVAGVMAEYDTVEHLDDPSLQQILDVNVGAVFRLGRHAIPELRRAGGGTIVNVASVHAYATMPRAAAYAASKGALVALTRQMALDLAADGIRVVCVAPGSVDTPLTRRELERRGLTPEEAGFAESGTAPGRMARPEEIAGVVAWLTSPGAAAVNGTTIVADAALLARLV